MCIICIIYLTNLSGALFIPFHTRSNNMRAYNAAVVFDLWQCTLTSLHILSERTESSMTHCGGVLTGNKVIIMWSDGLWWQTIVEFTAIMQRLIGLDLQFSSESVCTDAFSKRRYRPYAIDVIAPPCWGSKTKDATVFGQWSKPLLCTRLCLRPRAPGTFLTTAFTRNPLVLTPNARGRPDIMTSYAQGLLKENLNYVFVSYS